MKSKFEEYKHIEDGVEFWFARELQKVLEYAEWRNFTKLLEQQKSLVKLVDMM